MTESGPEPASDADLIARALYGPEPPAEEATETATDVPPPRARRALPGPWWAHVALVVVLVAGNAAGWTLWYQAGSAERERTSVDRVARRFARNLFTFDYRTLEADVKRIQADSTGRFHSELETALGGAGVFKDILVEAQSQSTGKLRRFVVVSVKGSTAKVFSQLDRTVQNKEQPEARTSAWLLDITLVRTDKGWKVDDVNAEGE